MALQANVAWKQGRPAEAAEKYRRVIDIRTELFGKDSPRIGELLSHYAQILTELGQHEEAQAAEEWRARIESKNSASPGT